MAHHRRGSTVTTTQAEPLLSPGTKVADATVEGRLAVGSTAVVYRGRHPNGPVAIKIALTTASERSEHRFRNEARLSSAVEHPNITPALAVGQLNSPPPFSGCMFVLFPLVEGIALSKERFYFPRGFPEARVRKFARQIASAIRALHAEGIVHRDIKPDNIICDEHDKLHLLDFGIAYATGTALTPKTNDVTLRGAAPGSTHYMSPQQLVHAAVTPSFDIFSFGATLFEWLTGEPPEYRVPEDDVARRRRSGDWSAPEFPATTEHPIPPTLAQLTRRCLASNPADRPTADELCDFFDADVASPTDDRDDKTVVSKAAAPGSNPTMPLRRPSVIADGARLAGESTMVKLARDAIPMPSVHRVHALAERLDDVADENVIVPANEFRAALVIAEDGLPALDKEATNAEPDDEHARRKTNRATTLPAVEQEPASVGARHRFALASALALSSFTLAAWWFTSTSPSPSTLRSGLVVSPTVLPTSPPSPHPRARQMPKPAPQPGPSPPPTLGSAKPETSSEPPPTDKPSQKRRPAPEAHKPAPAQKPLPPKALPNTPPPSPPQKTPRQTAGELRTAAKEFYRAGQYDRCIALANDSQDAELSRITSMCKRRKAREHDSP